MFKTLKKNMFVDPYVGIGGKNSNHWRGSPLSSETGVCEDVLYGSSQVLTAALKTNVTSQTPLPLRTCLVSKAVSSYR